MEVISPSEDCKIKTTKDLREILNDIPGSNKSGAPIMLWESNDSDSAPNQSHKVRSIGESRGDLIQLTNIMRQHNWEMINLKVEIMN